MSSEYRQSSLKVETTSSQKNFSCQRSIFFMNIDVGVIALYFLPQKLLFRCHFGFVPPDIAQLHSCSKNSRNLNSRRSLGMSRSSSTISMMSSSSRNFRMGNTFFMDLVFGPGTQLILNVYCSWVS